MAAAAGSAAQGVSAGRTHGTQQTAPSAAQYHSHAQQANDFPSNSPAPVKKMLRPDCTSCNARCCSSDSAARSSPPPTAALLSALLASAARLPAAAPREKPLAVGPTPPPGPLRSEMTLPPPQPLLLGAGPPAAPMVLSERGASGRRFCFRPGLLQGAAPGALLPQPPLLPLPTPACFSSTRLMRSRSSVSASGSAPLMLSWMHLEAAGNGDEQAMPCGEDGWSAARGAAAQDQIELHPFALHPTTR